MHDKIEEIYKEYAKQIYNFIFSICHNKYLAEEIVQETFYIAIKNINQFKGECKINVWLCQIAKRLCYKQIKKNNKFQNIPFEDMLNETSYIINYEDEHIDENDLYQKIKELDILSQQIILLRIKNDLTFKQIGEILGKSENFVRVKFYRIKEKLKEDINDEK